MAQGGFRILRRGSFSDLPDSTDYQAAQTQPPDLDKTMKAGTVEILMRAFDNAGTIQAATMTIQPILVLRTDQGGPALIGGRPAFTTVGVGEINEVQNVDCTGFGVRLTDPVPGSATKYEIWVRS